MMSAMEAIITIAALGVTACAPFLIGHAIVSKRLHRHRWRYWRDPDGEGPLWWVDRTKDDGIGPGPGSSIGVDRRTCRVCHKAQRFNYMGVLIFDHWKTIGNAIPKARATR